MIEDDKNEGKSSFLDLALPFRIICGLLFLAILVVTVLQIVLRFVFNEPLVWSEELARYMLIWLTFLGAGVVAWDGRHLSVDIFYNMVDDRYKAIIKKFNILAIAIFIFVFIYFSIPIIKIEMFSDIGALQIKGGWFRIPGIVGGVLIVLALILRLFYRVKRDKDSQKSTL